MFFACPPPIISPVSPALAHATLSRAPKLAHTHSADDTLTPLPPAHIPSPATITHPTARLRPSRLATLLLRQQDFSAPAHMRPPSPSIMQEVINWRPKWSTWAAFKVRYFCVMCLMCRSTDSLPVLRRFAVFNNVYLYSLLRIIYHTI